MGRFAMHLFLLVATFALLAHTRPVDGRAPRIPSRLSSTLAEHTRETVHADVRGSSLPVPLHSVDPATSIAAARALISRYYPRQAHLFNLSIATKPSRTAHDYFTVGSSSSSNSIAISGTSGVMLTAGFNYYLAEVCRVQLLTWSSATPPPLPSTLPGVPSGSVTVTSPYLLRYNYNICTLSYSTQWWNFTQWEREIDWMALRGINAPLALTGEDIVWLDTFTELGLNETEVLAFLAGPAFLAWSANTHCTALHCCRTRLVATQSQQRSRKSLSFCSQRAVCLCSSAGSAWATYRDGAVR